MKAVRVLWAVLAASVGMSSLPVAAEPVTFSFAAVPLVDFAQFTYRNLLGRDFVLSSELVGMGKKISVSVKSIDSDKLVPFVDQVLRSQGVQSVEREGVFFLEPVAAAQSPAAVSASGGSSLPSVPADAHAASVPGPEGQASKSEPELAEIRVVVVKNRPVEFVAAAVNAVAGGSVARSVGGSRMALAVPKPRLDSLLQLVEDLDVAADVVEVSASFVEVTTSDSDASGLSLVAGTVSRKFGVSVTPQSGRLAITAGRYDLVMEALAGDGRFKQVSNSRVVGDDEQKLSLSVGDETPTISSTSRDNQGNPIQNVVYRPSGVILDVLPRVLGSGRLSLQVDGQVSTFQATTNGVSGSPTLVKRQVKTGVSLRDGEVLVIGGLNDAKTNSASSGFSFLPDSWRTRSGSRSKTDLVLILSARVVSGVRDAAL